jgi:hypothetical protein
MSKQKIEKRTSGIVIDRIEGDWAIVDMEGIIFSLPLGCLPEGAHDGHMLRLDVSADEPGTQKKRQEIIDLQKELLGE